MERKLPVDTELPSKIYLFQGLPKQDKMELIVQKCGGTWGVSGDSGCHEAVSGKAGCEKRAEKGRTVAADCESAAKQAGRGCIPEVQPMSCLSGSPF